MDNDRFYNELKDAIAEYVSENTDESTHTDLKVAVEKYFEEEISRYSKEELMKYLEAPGKVIEHFKKYLDGKDCVLC